MVSSSAQENHFDEFREWTDGSIKCRYSLSTREAQSHSSAWAMKYTNNHNKFILKKTCVGVLLCNNNCSLKDGSKVRIRPAISDKGNHCFFIILHYPSLFSIRVRTSYVTMVGAEKQNTCGKTCY